MNINDKSQTTSRRKDRPLGSSAFSAGWGQALGLALLVLTAIPSFAGSKFSSDLPQQTKSGMVTVNVQYRQMPNNASLKSHGGTVRMKHHHINAVTLTLPANKLAELAADPHVAYITPDRPVSLSNTTYEEFATAVESDDAASQFALDGTGIGVAVIDSGIADHPDLYDAYGNSRVVYSQSFVAGDSTTADTFGHGTHVAGLVGGSGLNSGNANGYQANYAGMARNVNLINLRVLDQNGSGTDSQVIAAIEQAIALQSTYNIRVINMSLGRPVFESYTLDPVDQAVEAAWKAGIVVVVAAGNNGRYWPTNGFVTIGVPGNDPAVLTVGATMTENTISRGDDKIASYSSKGPTAIDHIVKPDVVAPGNGIVSLMSPNSTIATTNTSALVPNSYYQTNGSGQSSTYMRLSGTSMATPVVSGAVALL